MLGRLTLTDYTDANTPNIARTYDKNGKVKTVNRGSGGTAVNWTYNYGTLNNLTSETLSVDGGAKTFPMTYAYDADGFMDGRTLPSGRALSMINDGLGRLKQVSETGQVYVQNIAYHPSGQIAAMDYGNGQLFTQTLNARLQPEHLISQKGSNKALDLLYTYDLRGKVTSTTNVAITGDNRTYGYDALGRLTTATGSWRASAYKYDALGNIREKTVGTRTLVMTYNQTNRLTSHTDSEGPTRALSYDIRGNVTWLGSQRFTYDFADQPRKLLGDVTGDYTYDGNLKRVKSVVTKNGVTKTIYNVYDASGTLVHVDETTDGRTTDYIGKIARIKTEGGVSTPIWIHMDHLGSAQTMTSANGLVLCREQYTPYGTTLTNPMSNGDQAGFTGHIKDSATGLNYMQARYYDPLIGRFLSIDPVGFSPGQPQMFNRFAYVNNDPVNNIDPDGKDKVFVQGGLNIVPGMGFTRSIGIYVDLSPERATRSFIPGLPIIPDIGLFTNGGWQAGLAAGIGADAGYHKGNHETFNGKSDSLTLDAYVLSGNLSEPQGTRNDGTGNGSLGLGLGAGFSGGTTKTSTLLSTKSVINKLSRVLSYGPNVETKKVDGGVKVTSSKIGSRIKRSVTIPEKKKE